MASVRERILRILLLIPYLRQHPGVPLDELAERLGCSRKDVLADLDAILMCGVPPYLPTDYINVSIEQDRVYLVCADHFRRPVRLTLLEAFALRLGVATLAGKEGAEGSDLMRKIDMAMPGALRDTGERREEQFYFSSLPDAIEAKLEQTERAIAHRRKACIEYYSAGRDAMSLRTVHPYALVSHAGVWYLVAHCETRRGRVSFRIDRIKTFQITDEAFEIPGDFDIESYRHGELYAQSEADLEVVVRFGPELARWIREEMPGAQIVDEPDGSIRLTLFSHSMEWLVAWLVQYEDKAEVLSPPELRERMASVCAQMAGAYE